MPGTDALRRTAPFFLLLGLYFTARGYRSFEGDQAYRFPILKHQQDFRLYAADPFVRAFDRFNPHRGYLLLLDVAARPAGLAVAILGLYVLTFALTCAGLDRLARSTWPDLGRGVGVAAAALVLVAQAGNLGTNHLFEPILLERLIAFGLGWVAIGSLVDAPGRGPWRAPLALGLATFVHPSVGLQTAAVVTVAWVAWGALGWSEGVGRARFWGGAVGLGVAVVPGLWVNLRDSGLLLDGLPAEQVRLLSAELQSPQHMLPHLWRFPQWLAGGCYPTLAAVALASGGAVAGARRRLVALLALVLVGLAAAWVGIEVFGSLRLTLFQPFRMATVARGLCLVLVSGHVARLWARGGRLDLIRCALIAVGLAGDRSLVVVTGFEALMTLADAVAGRLSARNGLVFRGIGLAFLAYGVVFLSRHDTESGHVPILAAVGLTAVLGPVLRRRPLTGDGRQFAFRMAAAWAVPAAALAANVVPDNGLGPRVGEVRRSLVKRCRFAEVPADDVERLAVWCRKNTPGDAVFVGPPGPKTFRLWSLRPLAFNRAGSPYAAAGLGDWARRFADHVGLRGTPEDLVSAYLKDRHGLERRYDALSPVELAALAARQGAGYVVARPREFGGDGITPLDQLHVEGRYAVYRVRTTPALADRSGVSRPRPR